MNRFDYPCWVQEAYRHVVRRALEEVQRDGLEGDHHFYVIFRTRQPEVQIPPMLRDTHPETMTIVIQHQWWDLEVGDAAFSITLAFNGQKQRLTVPYAAIESFVDPGAEFGLRFDLLPAGRPQAADETTAEEQDSATADSASDNVVSLAEFRRRPRLVE